MLYCMHILYWFSSENKLLFWSPKMEYEDQRAIAKMHQIWGAQKCYTGFACEGGDLACRMDDGRWKDGFAKHVFHRTGAYACLKIIHCLQKVVCISYFQLLVWFFSMEKKLCPWCAQVAQLGLKSEQLRQRHSQCVDSRLHIPGFYIKDIDLAGLTSHLTIILPSLSYYCKLQGCTQILIQSCPVRTYNACATGNRLGCLIEMDREEILISHTTKSHVKLQGGEIKRNPEMEETALQPLPAQTADLSISRLRFISPLCT